MKGDLSPFKRAIARDNSEFPPLRRFGLENLSPVIGERAIVGNGQALVPEAEPRAGVFAVGGAVAVAVVAQQGMAEVRHVGPELVGAAGDGLQGHVAQIVPPPPEDPVAGAYGLRAGCVLMQHLHQAPAGVLYDKRVQRTLLPVKAPQRQGAVALAHAPVIPEGFEGLFMDGFFDVVERLRASGCGVVVLGCTELSVIGSDLRLTRRDGIVDSLNVLAEKSIEYCGRQVCRD